jgi:large subunit ribosomal protein L18
VISKVDKNAIRVGRHGRIRNKIKGTTARPRLNVYRSLNHIYAQIIDDVKGVTIAAASTVEKELAEKLNDKTKKEAAKLVGELAARRAMLKGVTEVVFDRGGYLYTGRVAELAQGARDAGLKF